MQSFNNNTSSSELLRHILATIAYRLNKVLHNPDEKFFLLQLPEGVRSPAEILCHMSQVLAHVPAVIEQRTAQKQEPLPWQKESGRFYELLKEADIALQKSNVTAETAMRLIQGPLADILTHTGQLAMMRRLAGNSLPGENFMKADVKMGSFGESEQKDGSA